MRPLLKYGLASSPKERTKIQPVTQGTTKKLIKIKGKPNLKISLSVEKIIPTEKLNYRLTIITQKEENSRRKKERSREFMKKKTKCRRIGYDFPSMG